MHQRGGLSVQHSRPTGAGLEGIPSLDGRDGPEELREVPHATDATDLAWRWAVWVSDSTGYDRIFQCSSDTRSPQPVLTCVSTEQVTLWLFNIAMANGPFTDDFTIIKPPFIMDFPVRYVSHNQMVQ